jgi:hypothetical protein
LNTVVTLNFSHIRGSGASDLRYAVADIIPVRNDGAPAREPKMGVVLDLSSRSSLERKIIVGPGSAVVSIKLPTGELLYQQVEVDSAELDATISFLAVGVRQLREVPRETTPYVLRVIEGYGSASSPPTESGENHSRKRWNVVQLKPREGKRNEDVELRKQLRMLAVMTVSPKQGNQGLARVSSTHEGSRQLDGRGNVRYFAPSDILGHVRELQASKLYGDEESSRAAWTLPIRNPGKAPVLDQREVGRFFALSYQSGEKFNLHHVACIPGAWRTADDSWATVEVKVESVGKRDVKKLRIEIEDPVFKVMLQFLQSGDISASFAMFQVAKEGLRQKFTNPYSAAAGGYVLLYAREDSDAERWSRWVDNLARNFPQLPDTKILYVTLLLQTPAGTAGWLAAGPLSRQQLYTEALSVALDIDRLGPPLFRLGLALHSSNLRILHSFFKDSVETVTNINAAMEQVQALSLRADPTQPFSVFSLEGEDDL